MNAFTSKTTKIKVPKSAFNSIPNDKIVDLSKLKAFADDKLIVIIFRKTWVSR